MEDWTIPANEAVSMNLTRHGKPIFEEPMVPSHTFAVFGDDEIIVGYKDLEINIDFRAHDLRPTVSIKHGQKMKPINDVMADLMDLDGRLSHFLPESAFESGVKESNGAEEEWTPPGELLHSYEVGKKKFQIWCSPLSDKRAKEMLSNMRIFVPFYIEGGTVEFLDEPDWAIQRWKVFFLFEVDGEEASPTYTLAGFSTSYRLWVFPVTEILAATSSTSDELPSSLPHTNFEPDQEQLPEQISSLTIPSRERISQFIILPPYQHQSHGSWLYTVMTTLFRQDTQVYEITVEEPNEDFDALRDYCDLAYLYECQPAFKSLELPDTIPRAELESDKKVPLDLLTPLDTLDKVRTASKIAPRQFQRITEIHLLSTIPPRHRNLTRISRRGASSDRNDRKYYFWRLLTKERVFVRNKDQLIQIDESERVGKVEETIGGVQDEYEERLRFFEARMDRGLRKCVASVVGNMAGEAGMIDNEKKRSGKTNGGSSRKKRKIVDEDEDEDESVGGNSASVAQKKPKISE